MKLNKIINEIRKDKDIYSKLTESTLSRVWQFIEENKYDFAVISAARIDLYTAEENIEQHEKLKSDIRELGYGYIEMKGRFEGFDELSLFIPKIKKDESISLGMKYKQITIIYKNDEIFVEIYTSEERGNKIGEYSTKFKSGSGKDNLTFSKELFKSFYSKLKKGSHRHKKFLFTIEEKENLTKYETISRIKKGDEVGWIKILEEECCEIK